MRRLHSRSCHSFLFPSKISLSAWSSFPSKCLLLLTRRCRCTGETHEREISMEGMSAQRHTNIRMWSQTTGRGGETKTRKKAFFHYADG